MMEPSLEDVLEKAAQLQELVPGAVLVGGSAAALYAHHRQSFDHDHVVADLAERFDTILENLEALGDWSMTRAQPGKIILGELGGIETGVRQLLRSRPLESAEIEVRGKRLLIPTAAEILRIKAWLALSRNQTRDYLDIAALAERIGLDEAASVLAGIDDYYADINRRPEAVATQLVRQLADPRPRDAEVTTQLASYKAWIGAGTIGRLSRRCSRISQRGCCDEHAISQPRLRHRPATGSVAGRGDRDAHRPRLAVRLAPACDRRSGATPGDPPHAPPRPSPAGASTTASTR